MMCLALVISQGIGLLTFSSGSSFPVNTQPAAGLLQAKLCQDLQIAAVSLQQ